jgi:hypothetical protein
MAVARYLGVGGGGDSSCKIRYARSPSDGSAVPAVDLNRGATERRGAFSTATCGIMTWAEQAASVLREGFNPPPTHGGTMKRRLPARPNLEHLRTQAKTLLAKLRDGDTEAARTFIEYLAEASRLSPEQVRQHGFRLADAQAAIARKSGFAAWPGLARHVDRLRSMEGTWGFCH